MRFSQQPTSHSVLLSHSPLGQPARLERPHLCAAGPAPVRRVYRCACPIRLQGASPGKGLHCSRAEEDLRRESPTTAPQCTERHAQARGTGTQTGMRTGMGKWKRQTGGKNCHEKESSNRTQSQPEGSKCKPIKFGRSWRAAKPEQMEVKLQ